MNADERAKAVEHAKKDFAFVQRGLLGKPTRLHALDRIEIWALALDAQLTAGQDAYDELATRYRRCVDELRKADQRVVAAEKENQRLRNENETLRLLQGLPADLVELLRNPSIVLPRDHECRLADGRTLHEHLEEWRNAPSDTASASLPPSQDTSC